jgi:hypothetical protein
VGAAVENTERGFDSPVCHEVASTTPIGKEGHVWSWAAPSAQTGLQKPRSYRTHFESHPLPKRVLLNAKSASGAEMDGKNPAEADAAAAGQSSAARYWPLFLVAGLFVLLAIGIILSARSHGGGR